MACDELMRPIPFITFAGDKIEEGAPELDPEVSKNPYNFQVSAKALDYLSSIQGPVSVVAIAGLYRTGKSYLLNLLLNRTKAHEMFHVGGTVNACTKGIWIWGAPVEKGEDNNNPTAGTILFLDTEGLGSGQRSTTQDTRLFALSLLLCSSFIYNSRGVIDSNALDDLGLVVNVSKYIRWNQDNKEEEAQKQQIFPSFTWVLRDFSLQLCDESGKRITSQEYLERALEPPAGETTRRNADIRNTLTSTFPQRSCVTLVRPATDEQTLQRLAQVNLSDTRLEFQAQVKALKADIFDNLKIKHMGNVKVTGPMFGQLAQEYINAFNAGDAPVVRQTWDRVVTHALESAKVHALAFAQREIEKAQQREPMECEDIGPFLDDMMSRVMDSYETQEFRLKHHQSHSDDSKLEFRQELFKELMERFHAFVDDNDRRSIEMCHRCLDETTSGGLTRSSPNQTVVVQRPSDEEMFLKLEHELDELKCAMEAQVQAYHVMARGPMKSRVLCDHLLSNILSRMQDWGQSIIKAFRVHGPELQNEVRAMQQKVQTAKGKTTALEEILAQQQVSYTQSLENIHERFVDTKESLVEECANKRLEVEHMCAQIQELRVVHQSEKTRLEGQILNTRESMASYESQAEKERTQRELDVRSVSRELLESERQFHSEEKNLLHGQESLLSKVIELERRLGEQQAQQMKECFELEERSNEKQHDMQTKHDQMMDEMKLTALKEIQHLQGTQEREKHILEDQLNQLQSETSAFKERLPPKPKSKKSKSLVSNNLPLPNLKSIPLSPMPTPARNPTTRLTLKTKSAKDCSLQ